MISAAPVVAIALSEAVPAGSAVVSVKATLRTVITVEAALRTVITIEASAPGRVVTIKPTLRTVITVEAALRPLVTIEATATRSIIAIEPTLRPVITIETTLRPVITVKTTTARSVIAIKPTLRPVITVKTTAARSVIAIKPTLRTLVTAEAIVAGSVALAVTPAAVSAAIVALEAAASTVRVGVAWFPVGARGALAVRRPVPAILSVPALLPARGCRVFCAVAAVLRAPGGRRSVGVSGPVVGARRRALLEMGHLLLPGCEQAAFTRQRHRRGQVAEGVHPVAIRRDSSPRNTHTQTAASRCSVEGRPTYPTRPRAKARALRRAAPERIGRAIRLRSCCSRSRVALPDRRWRAR
uniref:hypothetical protein n=1 Tax=Curtobacterium ammoniigenes TaxID=395387 RepID=UPI00357175C6